MQKVTNFLEQHVQWVAIALGALFALWMAYGYILESPAKVTVDNQVFTGADIYKHTTETAAQQLQQKVNSTNAVTLAVPKPAEQFKDAMAWQGAKDHTVLAYIWPMLPAEVFNKTPETPGAPVVPGAPGQPLPAAVVEKLPIPPTPKPEEARVGRSTVTIPAVQVAAAPAEAQPGVAPAAPAGPAVPQDVDKDWVTQSFTIPMAEMDAAFKQAKIPLMAPLYSTCFLQVEMVRQEVTFDGKNVGPEAVVKGLEVSATGQSVSAYPGDGADRQAQATYLAWATQNTQQILQPAFYTVTKGDVWAAPGTILQTQQQNYTLDNPPPNWQQIPEWKDAVHKYRQQKYKERSDQKKQSAPRPSATPGARSSPGAAGGNFAPAPRDTARPAPPPRIPGEMQAPQAGAAAIGMAPGEGGVGGAPAPVVGQLPTGDFDPSKFRDPIQVWAHDISVTPGKTYKYKMRYRIRNPLFGVSNVAKNPSLANVFALLSADSEWSKPVTVPAKTNFFVARNITGNATSVQFEVFKWEDGVQHADMFSAAPGDAIGGLKGNTDFTTDWTLVGFQADSHSGETQILLVDKEGALMTRSARSDSVNPLYKTLKDQVSAITKQANGGAGVPGVPGATAGINRAP
jgi:hypothetical protein